MFLAMTGICHRERSVAIYSFRMDCFTAESAVCDDKKQGLLRHIVPRNDKKQGLLRHDVPRNDRHMSSRAERGDLLLQNGPPLRLIGDPQ